MSPMEELRMRVSKRTRLFVALGVAAAMLSLAACSTDEPTAENEATADQSAPAADCEAYADYGDLTGKTINVYAGFRGTEGDLLDASFDKFRECTGADVVYEGSAEFEAQIQVRAEAGNMPDISFHGQPGMVATLVGMDVVVEPPAEVAENVDTYWTPAWKDYGTVDGTFYAAPLGASVKDYVWYSPTMFAEGGYEIPTTLDDLLALSQQIVDDGGVPWCEGFESGEATGWKGTDWLEEMVLRYAGEDVYDQWVAGEVEFGDQAILEALDAVAQFLKNPDFVNGGLGGVDSIAMTGFGDAGLPIAEGLCYMHRASTTYGANYSDDVTIAEDGDIYAFYFPGVAEDDLYLLGGGEFVTAHADRPEVQAFQTYLSTPEWANQRAAQGQWYSANNGLDLQYVASDLDKQAAQLLTNPDAIFRFDASDLMPSAVGAGSFWTGMTDWILGDTDEETAAFIDSTWP